MEHRFIGLGDGFIHCIALCRQRVIECSAEDVMATLLKGVATATSSTECLDRLENGGGGVIVGNGGTEYVGSNKLKPEMSPEVAKWLEWNEISSASLRNECWFFGQERILLDVGIFHNGEWTSRSIVRIVKTSKYASYSRNCGYLYLAVLMLFPRKAMPRWLWWILNLCYLLTSVEINSTNFINLSISCM